MGWKEFAASIFATTLSWPVAFIVVVVVFYKPLKHLIGRVRSGKVAGVEFEIREELREADTAARKSKPLPIPSQGRSISNPLPTDESPRPEAENLLENPIGVGVEEAVEQEDLDAADRIHSAFDRMYFVWGRLESSLRRLYEYAVVGDPPKFLSVDRATDILFRGEILDEEFVDSVASLRAVLDEVSVTGYASHSTARKFTRTAARLHGIVERQNEFYARWDR